jgi:hypothetical protein
MYLLSPSVPAGGWTIAPGQSVTPKVAPTQVPITRFGLNVFTLTVASTANTATVPVHETGRGVLFAWEPNPATITTAAGGTFSSTVRLVNMGDVNAAIRIYAGQVFDQYVYLAPPNQQFPTAISAGQSIPIPMQFAARVRGTHTSHYEVIETSGMANCNPRDGNGNIIPVRLVAQGIFQ